MLLFQQNEVNAGRRDIYVQMVDAVDLVSPKTGLNVTAEIVKAGTGVYVSIVGVVSEVGSGTYRVNLALGDLDTLGHAMLKLTAPGAANQYVPLQVVRFLDEVHLAKAALANARRHTVETGVDVILDDDGEAVLHTLTPAEADGIVSVIPT